MADFTRCRSQQPMCIAKTLNGRLLDQAGTTGNSYITNPAKSLDDPFKSLGFCSQNRRFARKYLPERRVIEPL
jgi:hypothetical protein